MERKIIKYPDPLLARKSEPVAEITDEIRELVEDMTKAMYDNDGIGLAAPQVGQSIRLVVTDLSGPKERADLRVWVNPEIVSRDGSVVSEEGCLSVVGLRAKVERAAQVKVKATDLDGNAVEVDADEMLAICLQHEIDHLDGILFIDHISRLKRSLYDSKVKKWLKQDRL
ncbi:MAG: peptide deformylase [Desulfovibrio sp.]|uniref:peptide deformylase n=1 Tax=Desulfovibrio sp. 7SRBS1 TaxID=3378064 RepID=UPI003B414330